MSQRILRVLLLLYPRDWRDRYATEVRRLTEDLLESDYSAAGALLDIAAGGIAQRARGTARFLLASPRRVLISSIILAGGVLAWTVSGGLNPSTNPSVTAVGAASLPDPSAAPVAPGPGASLAQWQQYGAEQRVTMEAVDWSTPFNSPGCTVTSAVVAPIEGTAPGVPYAVGTDAVTITGQCGTSSGRLPSVAVGKQHPIPTARELVAPALTALLR